MPEDAGIGQRSGLKEPGTLLRKRGRPGKMGFGPAPFSRKRLRRDPAHEAVYERHDLVLQVLAGRAHELASERQVDDAMDGGEERAGAQGYGFGGKIRAELRQGAG